VTGSVQQRNKISKKRKKTSRYERFFHYRLFNLDSANRFAEELGYSLITC
jgi:ribosomal protein S10